jgi:hypothetical protein
MQKIYDTLLCFSMFILVFLVYLSWEKSKAESKIQDRMNVPARNIYLENNGADEPPLLEEISQVNDHHVFQLFAHGRAGQLYIQNQWMGPQKIAQFLKGIMSPNITQINIYDEEFARGKIGRDAITYLQNALNVSIVTINNSAEKEGGMGAKKITKL